MSENGATITVWLCPRCNAPHDMSEQVCVDCHLARLVKWSNYEISLFSEAAQAILARLGKATPKRKRAAKKGEKTKTEKAPKGVSPLEWQFKTLWKETGYPMPKEEFRFHKTRRWRFDYAFTDYLIAVELEGGVYSRGRHTRGKGYEADCIKYNAAVLLDWKVLRFTKVNADTIETVKQLIDKQVGMRKKAVA